MAQSAIPDMKDNLQESNSLNHWLLHKDWQKVESYLSELRPSNWDAKAHLAQGMLSAYGSCKKHDIDQSIAHLRKACQLAPEEPRYLNAISEVYLSAKEPLRALEAAQRSCQLATENPFSNIALGRAAMVYGDYELAHYGFSMALLGLPDDIPVLRKEISSLRFKFAPFWRDPLYGKRVSLHRMTEQFKKFIFHCRQNTIFQGHYNLFQGQSEDAVLHDLRDALRPPLDSKKIEWIVQQKGKPIGIAALVDLDLSNSRAEIQVGFPQRQQPGIALEATLLIMEFAFATLGIFKLISYVYTDNPESQRNTLHLGFKQEGFLRSHVVNPRSKERLGLYVNGCLSQEYFSNPSLMKLSKRLLGRIPRTGYQALIVLT